MSKNKGKPINPKNEMEEDEDPFQKVFNKAIGGYKKQNQQTAVASETSEEEPQPVINSEQAARIIAARPRRTPRRAGATASASSSGRLPLPPPQSLTPSTNPSQPSQSPSRGPEPIAPQTTAQPPMDKGKGKEVWDGFDVPAFELPAHERPLTKEEEDGLNSLNIAQTWNLIQRHREEIEAEILPRHKKQFYAEIDDHLQANYNAALAAETARLEQENQSLQDQLKTMKQSSHASFKKGQEKGKTDAISEHATRWKAMDQQIEDKKKQLQSRESKLGQGQATKVASQARKPDEQAEEHERMMKEGREYVGHLEAQLAERNEEVRRGRAERASNAAIYRQQLVARGRELNRLRIQLAPEQLGYREDEDIAMLDIEEDIDIVMQEADHTPETEDSPMADAAPESAKMANAQLLQRLKYQQATTEQLWHAHEQLQHANEQLQQTNEQLWQAHGQLQHGNEQLQSTNEELLQDLVGQKTANETLQKSVDDHRAAKRNQTSVDSCAAKLQKLQACLEKKHAKELEEQAARMLESFKADTKALLAEKDAEAAAEVRAFERAFDGLLTKFEAAKKTTRSLQTRDKELEAANQKLEAANEKLEATNEKLDREKKTLQASLSRRNEDYRVLRHQADSFEASAEQSKQTATGLRADLEASRQAARAAESQTRSLQAANSTLTAEKRELEQRCTFANAELTAALEKLDRCQVQSKHLAAELGKVNTRLTECEATLKKEVDEVRKLEKFVDDEWVKWEQEARGAAVEAAVEEAEEGEREMDAPLGVLEEVNEGLLQPQVPGWRDFLFLLFLLFLVVVVVGMATISVANHRRRLEGGEDPWLDLSRGMYGG